MSHMLRAWLIVALSASLVACNPAPLKPARSKASASSKVSQVYLAPLTQAVRDLRVADEVREGYDRDLFQHWIDADRDGCNTRYEVLIEEAEEDPAITPGCHLIGGRWFSPYDGATWTDPADLDIDHVVALAEAWDSGARQWTTARRRSFANDLGDYRTLVAVTDDVNQAKGDKDPADWLPPKRVCRFIAHWTAVKLRWRLSIDARERRTLIYWADTCPPSVIRVVRV